MAASFKNFKAKYFRYALETLAVYVFYIVFRLLPLEISSWLGGMIMRGIGPLLKRRCKVALDNLDLAFPEKTPEEKQAILLGMWENLGRVAGEYPHLHGIMDNVETVGTENLEFARASGKPLLFIAGHLSNWEINAIITKKGHIPIHLVYRKPNNPGVDSLLRHARDSGAIGHIEKSREGARQIVSVLKKKGVVGMLIDQKLNSGIPVPFFGVDAMTTDAPAQFALRMDCQLYPFRTQRLKGAHFRTTVYPAMQIEKTGDHDADVLRIMTEINRLLESWIRETPEQWLWIHKRWQKQ